MATGFFQIAILLLVSISYVKSLKIIDNLKLDKKNLASTNDFIRSVLRAKNDLQWIQEAGQQLENLNGNQKYSYVKNGESLMETPESRKTLFEKALPFVSSDYDQISEDDDYRKKRQLKRSKYQKFARSFQRRNVKNIENNKFKEWFVHSGRNREGENKNKNGKEGKENRKGMDMNSNSTSVISDVKYNITDKNLSNDDENMFDPTRNLMYDEKQIRMASMTVDDEPVVEHDTLGLKKIYHKGRKEQKEEKTPGRSLEEIRRIRSLINRLAAVKEWKKQILYPNVDNKMDKEIIFHLGSKNVTQKKFDNGTVQKPIKTTAEKNSFLSLKNEQGGCNDTHTLNLTTALFEIIFLNTTNQTLKAESSTKSFITWNMTNQTPFNSTLSNYSTSNQNIISIADKTKINDTHNNSSYWEFRSNLTERQNDSSTSQNLSDPVLIQNDKSKIRSHSIQNSKIKLQQKRNKNSNSKQELAEKNRMILFQHNLHDTKTKYPSNTHPQSAMRLENYPTFSDPNLHDGSSQIDIPSPKTVLIPVVNQQGPNSQTHYHESPEREPLESSEDQAQKLLDVDSQFHERNEPEFDYNQAKNRLTINDGLTNFHDYNSETGNENPIPETDEESEEYYVNNPDYQTFMRKKAFLEDYFEKDYRKESELENSLNENYGDADGNAPFMKRYMRDKRKYKAKRKNDDHSAIPGKTMSRRFYHYPKFNSRKLLGFENSSIENDTTKNLTSTKKPSKSTHTIQVIETSVLKNNTFEESLKNLHDGDFRKKRNVNYYDDDVDDVLQGKLIKELDYENGEEQELERNQRDKKRNIKNYFKLDNEYDYKDTVLSSTQKYRFKNRIMKFFNIAQSKETMPLDYLENGKEESEIKRKIIGDQNKSMVKKRNKILIYIPETNLVPDFREVKDDSHFVGALPVTECKTIIQTTTSNCIQTTTTEEPSSKSTTCPPTTTSVPATTTCSTSVTIPPKKIKNPKVLSHNTPLTFKALKEDFIDELEVMSKKNGRPTQFSLHKANQKSSSRSTTPKPNVRCRKHRRATSATVACNVKVTWNCPIIQHFLVKSYIMSLFRLYKTLPTYDRLFFGRLRKEQSVPVFKIVRDTEDEDFLNGTFFATVDTMQQPCQKQFEKNHKEPLCNKVFLDKSSSKLTQNNPEQLFEDYDYNGRKLTQSKRYKRHISRKYPRRRHLTRHKRRKKMHKIHFKGGKNFQGIKKISVNHNVRTNIADRPKNRPGRQTNNMPSIVVPPIHHRPEIDDIQKAKGVLPLSIIDSVYRQVQEKENLKHAVGPGLKKQHQSVVPIQEIDKFKDKEIELQVKHAEDMLHLIMKAINNIVFEQVSAHTCQHLEPNLQKYLNWLTEGRYQDLGVHKTFQGLGANRLTPQKQDVFLFGSPMSGYKNKFDPVQIKREKTVVKNLIGKFNRLNLDDKNRFKEVKTLLERNNQILDTLNETRKRQSRNQDQRKVNWNKRDVDTHISEKYTKLSERAKFFKTLSDLQRVERKIEDRKNKTVKDYYEEPVIVKRV